MLIPEGMKLTGKKPMCHFVDRKCHMDRLVVGHALLRRKAGP